MSEGNQPEVVLNEFGELSRKSRRELIAFGVDPDTAVIEHIRTQSIPVVADSPAASAVPSAPPAVVAPPEVVAPPVPIVPPVAVAPPTVLAPAQALPSTEASVFSPSLSRRDMRNLRERSEATSEIPIMHDRAESETSVSMPQTPVVAEQDILPTPSEQVVDSVVVIDDETGQSKESAPQTIAEATASTAISEAIASRRRSGSRGDGEINRRDDSSEILGDYEPFSISSMSTQSTGVIPNTGSAFILPTLPEHSPGAMASFSHTGEIYLTGSIALPSSMGHYGADFLSLDTSEIDVIAEDDEIASNQDLAPIRASSAVSAYSTSNTVVTVPSKFKDRLPLVLAITAAGLAVGVVALFVSGYVLGVF